MQIYDCVIFNEELDVLEIRLNILESYVDWFVVCEGDRTFRGNPKESQFLSNRDRYERWRDKIIHVNVPLPVGNPWDAEACQRNGINRGLVEACEDDLILVSDVDEIWNPQKRAVIEDATDSGPVKLRQRFFYYYLNLETLQECSAAAACRKRDLAIPENLRRGPATATLLDMGWHFSYLGGSEAIRRKIQSFSHSELDTPEFTDLSHIDHCLRVGTDLFNRPFGMRWVKIDQSYPEYILRNQERLQAHIR